MKEKSSHSVSAEHSEKSKENTPLTVGDDIESAKPEAAPRMVIEEQIGRQLRAVYQDVLTQPIPDRFLQLIEQLSAAEGGTGGVVDKT